MTKAQELAILDTAIAQLGDRSYLGPWLASVRADVAATIATDLDPITLPSTAVVRAVAIIEDAKQRARELMTQAQRRADDLRAAGLADCANQRRDLAYSLRNALYKLND